MKIHKSEKKLAICQELSVSSVTFPQSKVQKVSYYGTSEAQSSLNV